MGSAGGRADDPSHRAMIGLAITTHKCKGNTMTPWQRLAAASALLTAHVAAHAVVSFGHWAVANAPSGTLPDFNLTITLDQTIGGDYTSSFWKYDAQAGTLRFVTLNADEGSVLFLVKPGEVVSQAMVNAPGIHSLGDSSAAVLVGKDFYLGAATSSLSDPGVTWSNYQQRTSFGWAHFQAQADGSLKILDSAMAFREAGIVVGTLQAVPEPGTWMLMGLGLVGLGAVARRRG